MSQGTPLKDSRNSFHSAEPQQDDSITGLRRPSYTSTSKRSNLSIDNKSMLHDESASYAMSIESQGAPTPLPRMQMFIVSIILLSEPLTSVILLPFIYFMLKDFHLSDDEKVIGFYAGWITSIYFLAQFFSSIYWGSISDRRGRRPVLLIGLIGNTLTCTMFGLSKSLWWAIGTRALCGILNGNAGVARSMVGEITDKSNRVRAFSIVGFCWGMGMIGSSIGGYLCKPTEHFPSLFGGNQFLKEYPYFLPCFVSSLGSLFGFVIGFFNLKESNQAVIARDKAKDDRSSKVNESLTNMDERTWLLRSRESERPVINEEREPDHHDDRNIFMRISKVTYTIILCHCIFALHAMMFDEIIPLYFCAPHEASGLGLDTKELAKIVSVGGILQMIVQFLIYPELCKHFSILTVCRATLVVFCLLYFMLPELYVYQEWLMTHVLDDISRKWAFRAGYMTILYGRYMGNCVAFACFTILLNNSAAVSEIGTANGISQSLQSLMRACGPTIGGTIWSYSIRSGLGFPFDRHLVCYLIGLLNFIGLIQSYLIPKSISLGGNKR